MKYLAAFLGLAALAATAMILKNVPVRQETDWLEGKGDPQAQSFRSAVDRQPDSPGDPAQPGGAGEPEFFPGIRAREDRSCEVTRHYLDQGDGTVTAAFSCVGSGAASGRYGHYDDGALEMMAYGDAGAASELGKRLAATEPGRARGLMVRALALQPGNTEPAMWLASQAYSLRGDSAAARTAMADQYVITRVAQELGARVSAAWILDDLRESGADDAVLARLDARVAADLRRIESIQLEVFGRRRFGEELR